MRTKLGFATALALSVITVPSVVQAQDYRGHAGYDYGQGHDRYDGHSAREHRRWERERERQRLRWERAHRHDHRGNPYR